MADSAGGRWPELARAAALALSADRCEESLGVRLLADIKTLFDRRAVDRMRTEEIPDSLNGMEDRPWPELSRGDKPMTAGAPARRLKPFSITPRSIRFGADFAKGIPI